MSYCRQRFALRLPILVLGCWLCCPALVAQVPEGPLREQTFRDKPGPEHSATRNEAPAELPPFETTVAYDVLVRTEQFDWPTEHTPEMAEVFAFRRLLQRSDAALVFRRLWSVAQPAGRLYALCGLYWTNRSEALRLAASWRPGEATVISYVGGAWRALSIERTLRNPDPSTLRLSLWDTLPKRAASDPHWFLWFSLDVVGGGIPLSIRGVEPSKSGVEPGGVAEPAWDELLTAFVEERKPTLLYELNAHQGPTPGVLLDALQCESPERRRAAAEALVERGYRGADAARRLGQLLDDPDVSVRMQALRTLERLGPWNRDAVGDVLRLALQLPAELDPDADEYAAPEDARIEDFHAGLVGSLLYLQGSGSARHIALFTHPSPIVRTAVIVGLGPADARLLHLGDVLLARLDDSVAFVRQAALVAVKRWVRRSSTLPNGFLKAARQRIQMLFGRSEDASERRHAAAVLGQLGRSGDGIDRSVLETLLRAVREDPDSWVRWAALSEAASLRGVPTELALEFCAAVTEPRFTLGYSPPEFEAPKPGSLESDSPSSRLVRWWLYEFVPDALAPPDLSRIVVSLGRADAAVVDALTVLVADADGSPRMREWAVRCLGRIGPPASSALSVLRDVSPEETYAHSLAAAEAVARISGDPSGVLEIQRGRYVSGDRRERLSAVAAVAEYGRGAVSAVPWLVKACDDAESEVRTRAAQVLAQVVSPDSLEHYPELLPRVIEGLTPQAGEPEWSFNPRPFLRALVALESTDANAIAAVRRLHRSPPVQWALKVLQAE